MNDRELELARILQIAKVGGVVIDLRDGFRNHRSAEYLAIHGLPPDAVNESHEDWVARLHPDDRVRAEQQFLGVLKGTDERYSSEYRIIRPNDGQIRWIAAEGHIERDADGKPQRMVGAHIDITDRSHAREMLRESEERFRLIANSAPVPMWVSRLDGKRAFANQAYLDFLGLGYDDALAFDWRTILHPDDMPRIVQESIDGEASLKPFVLEARYRSASGPWRWMRSESQPRWDPNGKHIGFIGVAHDITAAKEAERELRALNDTLEQRIKERTAQLQSNEEALRQAQKMEAVGQLTGGVAHDFNNLLTIIRSATDFLRRSDLPPARRGRYIDAISDTVDRASKLTGQLLAFARRQPLAPQVFNVGSQVRHIAELIRPLVGARIQIDLDLGHSDCFAVADVVQFETALVNLAVNARDAMSGEGRLAISVRLADGIPELRAGSGFPGDFVAIAVTDTGAGIAVEHLDAIFEPFFTTKEVGKGTGLGLSQAYGFAKQSGGEIRVTSALGLGSTFSIYLPRAARPADAPVAAPRGNDSEAGGRGHRLLVVEDNEEVGRFSTELLEDLGYAIKWVTNAEAALTALSENASGFDLVFSDVIMPGMNGVDLAAVLRDRYPDLPVVLTSGYSSVLAENIDRGFELIRKPYSVEALSLTLRKAIAERRSSAD